jgi:hypothetical protein
MVAPIAPGWRIGMTAPASSPVAGADFRSEAGEPLSEHCKPHTHAETSTDIEPDQRREPTELILPDSQIFGGRLATVAHFFVARLGTLIEAAQSRFFDGRDVHEDILARCRVE